MAYDTASPPFLITQALAGGAGKVWLYRSTDGASDVDAANYITNGGSLGMAVGDLVYVIDTNASPVILTIHQVSATGDGTTDLNDLTTVTQTDSD
jgi:hypothetical protein